MRRLLIAIGIVCLLVGLAWPWLARLPLGRLPGDLVFERRGFKVYVPLASSLLIGLIVSLLLRLFRR